jgi:Fe-Mn family superoxide dismutase
MSPRYVLPDLAYAVDALEPWCPAETLDLHHGKHHATYVKAANAAAELLATIDPDDADRLVGARSSLVFNLGGHVLHSLLWTSIGPDSTAPTGDLAARLTSDFGSQERFTALFTTACMTVQGTGWGTLWLHVPTGELHVGSLLDHQHNMVPDSALLAVIDVWEHAYYLTYRHERAKWVAAAIDHLDWASIAARYDRAMSSGEALHGVL